MTRLFSRRKGRHCARGSLTGWAALASVSPAPQHGDFTQPRTPLAMFPMAATTRPYTRKDAAA